MKAVILHGKYDVSVEDFPVATVGETDVKIAVSYCGLCGSDLHKYEGKKNTHPIHYPVPLGHEISGHVVEVGSRAAGFKVGDPVTIDPNWSCGRCSFCQRGLTQFCVNARGVVKGMAQYVVAPVENVYHLPEEMDLRVAALTEPAACCLHGMDLLDMHLGDVGAIVGFGAIGQIMFQLMHAAGASSIYVIDTDESKRERAEEFGAAGFVLATDAEAISRLAQSVNIDKVMECVGVHEAQQMAILLAGKGATVVLFGVSDEADVLPFSAYEAFTKELTIKTSFVNPHTTQRAIAVLNSGLLDTDKLICKELSMEEIVTELAERKYCRSGKVIVKIDENLR